MSAYHLFAGKCTILKRKVYNLKPLCESIKMLLNVQISTKANKVIGWPKRQTLVGVIIALPFFSSQHSGENSDYVRLNV